LTIIFNIVNYIQTIISNFSLDYIDCHRTFGLEKMKNKDAIIILTTTDSSAEADKIAKYLIEQRLAACVNIIPEIKSHYRWKGEVVSDEEWLLVIKTSTKVELKIVESIKNLHSYDLPEIVILPIGGGNNEYLQWIRESVTD